MGPRYDSPGDVPRPRTDADSSGDGGTVEAGDDRDPVRVLFNVGHPAQVHLFRHAIAELEAAGHETLVASRHKEMTTALLDAFDVDHVPLTEQAGSLPGLVVELSRRERRLYAVARRFEPDVVVGRLAPPPVHVARLVGCRNLVVCDTLRGSRVMQGLNHLLTLPFVDEMCVPDQFDLAVAEEKRQHLAFQELAYLHPRYFTPDPTVLDAHGIDADEPFYVLRLTGWDAYHDAGHAGLSASGVRELAAFLDDHGTVYVSAEGEIPDDVPASALPTPPAAAHHVLYYADLYVGDSGTMSAEAAMLGTPAVRTNSLVDTTGEMVYDALEDRYGLLESVVAEDDAIAAAKRLVREPPDERQLRQARARLIEEHPDVTRVLVDAILDSAGVDDDDSAPDANRDVEATTDHV